MAFRVMPAYRPVGGEAAPRETELARSIRRETGDPNFFTFQNDSGTWVVGYRLGNGSIIDAGYAGTGDRPDCGRGLVESMRSMLQAMQSGAGPIRDAMRFLNEKDSEQRRRLEDKQEEYLDRRDFTRRRMGPHYWDMPIFGAARPRIIRPTRRLVI